MEKEFSLALIPEFTENDYYSTKPFEFLNGVRKEYGEYSMIQAKSYLEGVAKKEYSISKAEFGTKLKAYFKDLQRTVSNEICNYTNFSKQPMILNCGEWEADDSGIYGYDKLGFRIQACSHPIMPIKRMRNFETGEIKITLAFRRGMGKWEYVTVDKQVISSNATIIQLAKKDIAVTSENARYLVSFLSDVESLNYDALKEVKSTTKMGWIADGVFAPYSPDIEFDGDENFGSMYESITEQGSYEIWKDTVSKIRNNENKNGLYARIVLASSFASVLIKDCKLLPFFVHLWGGTESGKTVSIMLAASVWGNPEVGKYAQTFNSTFVAQEMLASFVNNMPLIMDELQIIKDRLSFDEMIYKLTEGAGKSRGKKDGGIQRTSTWRNCILTTGEYPIVNSHSGSGAVNRIIEIDCKGIQFFENPKTVVDIITENYGFAGREFINYLLEPKNMEKAVKRQKYYYKELEKFDNMSKQAAAASVILAADEIVTKLIFKDGHNLKINDLAPLLVSRFKASQNERAYEYIVDCVTINKKRFEKDSFGEFNGEIWGYKDHDICYIIKAKFDDMLENGGYNAKAFISWGIQTGRIIPKSATSPTVVKRVDGSSCRCIALVIEGVDFEEEKKKAPVKKKPVVEEKKSEDIFADFDFDDEYEVL